MKLLIQYDLKPPCTLLELFKVNYYFIVQIRVRGRTSLELTFVEV